MRKYSILISNIHRYGGGQRVYVRILAKRLHQLGHKLFVACPENSRLAEECKSEGIEVVGFRFDGGFTPISFFQDVRLALRTKTEKRIDLVHANGSRDHWVMATANLFSRDKTPVVRTIHNTKRRRYDLLHQFLYRRMTSQTISVCHYVKDILSTTPLFKNQDISVVHNGVELERFAPIPPDQSVRKEFGIEPGEVVVGIVGRLDWDKGHKYLFEAAAPLIKGEFPNMKILVVGSGQKQSELDRLRERLQISRNVIFAGGRSDIKEVISIFDIGVHPSIGVDTSSYAMKEMMAMEIPLVYSSYGGLTEIGDDGVTGFVVPPEDSDLLRDQIARLCRSGELREKFGKAGREKVLKEFSAASSVQKTLEVYEHTIERFNKGAGSRE
jgi:glycosyltransferase involved in cell wall biosynthesis